MATEIKKLNENAVIPQYAHPTDAGLDLVEVSKRKDKDGNTLNCALEHDDFRRKSLGHTYHETTAIINKLREYKKDDGWLRSSIPRK